MPKLKNSKAVSKRITKTKNKKVMIRAGGQDHFNARDTGKAGINKRRDHQMSKTNNRSIQRLVPYL